MYYIKSLLSYYADLIQYIRTILVNTSLIVGFAFVASGCLFTTTQTPSYILIGVDRLSWNSLSCPEYLDRGEGAFYQLCADFIRFTNAYTTSIQSAASITSVLTGLYPIEHGVRHSDHYLSSKHRSIALDFYDRNYETAFFSGGDPIPSYIGLQKGFMSFFDFSGNHEHKAKNMSAIFDSFAKWFFKDSQPSFAVLYIPTLRHEDQEGLGFEELEKNLTQLFQNLKKNKRWHNTHVVVFGLQGSLKASAESMWPVIDLSEDNIKVEMFFKPATKPRDKDISFLVDQNVSLVDLGQTLFDLAGSTPPQGTTSEFFNKGSFKNVLQRTTAPKLKRTLLVESGWPDWRYGYSPVYLVVEDQYRVGLNKQMQIYNTLLGRHLSGLPDGQIPENRWLSFIKVAAWLNSDGQNQFTSAELEKLSLGKKIWSGERYNYQEVKEDLIALYERQSQSEELLGWKAQLAIINQDCTWLLDIAKKSKNYKWELAARSCLRKKINLSPRTKYQCQLLFKKSTKEWPKECQSDVVYYSWRYLNESASNVGLEEELKTLLLQRKQRESLQQDNWRTFLSSAKIYEMGIQPDEFDLYYLQLKKSDKEKLDSLLSEN